MMKKQTASLCVGDLIKEKGDHPFLVVGTDQKTVTLRQCTSSAMNKKISTIKITQQKLGPSAGYAWETYVVMWSTDKNFQKPIQTLEKSDGADHECIAAFKDITTHQRWSAISDPNKSTPAYEED